MLRVPVRNSEHYDYEGDPASQELETLMTKLEANEITHLNGDVIINTWNSTLSFTSIHIGC